MYSFGTSLAKAGEIAVVASATAGYRRLYCRLVHPFI